MMRKKISSYKELKLEQANLRKQEEMAFLELKNQYLTLRFNLLNGVLSSVVNLFKFK